VVKLRCRRVPEEQNVPYHSDASKQKARRSTENVCRDRESSGSIPRISAVERSAPSELQKHVFCFSGCSGWQGAFEALF